MKKIYVHTTEYRYSYSIFKDFSSLMEVHGFIYFNNTNICKDKINLKKPTLLLFDIFVEKRFRLNYIGTKIISDLKNKNIDSIILIANVDNKEKSESELTHFYLKNNFEIIGYNEHYPIMIWIKY